MKYGISKNKRYILWSDKSIFLGTSLIRLLDILPAFEQAVLLLDVEEYNE